MKKDEIIYWYSLTPEERYNVVKQLYIEGLSFQEIAIKCGVTRQGINHFFHRYRKVHDKNFDYKRFYKFQAKRVPRIEIVCEQCGKSLVVTEHVSKTKRFCSRECATDAIRVTPEYREKRLKQYHKEYNQRPEVKERIRLYQKLPHVREYQRKWAEKNRERILELKRHNYYKNKIKKGYYMKSKYAKVFLRESNHIENEYSNIALDDALAAWEWAFEKILKHEQAMDVSIVLGIHDILMKTLNKRIAGKFRDCDVYIGGRHCKFTGSDDIMSKIQIWCDMFNDVTLEGYTKEGAESFLKDVHVLFEVIHPFEDGNGRTGRILYNLHRMRRGFPIHVIYEKDKHAYYKWFQ